MARNMDRREFLTLIALPALGAAIAACDEEGGGDGPIIPDINPDDGPQNYTVAELAAAYFGTSDLADVRLVGRNYLDSFESSDAATADLRILLQAIYDLPTAEDGAATAQDAVAADFAAVEIYWLHGWALSPTELRVCAVVETLIDVVPEETETDDEAEE